MEKEAEYSRLVEGPPLDPYHGGARPALLMVDDVDEAAKVKEAVVELGYRPVPAGNSIQGIGWMRFHEFGLVVLFDPYDGVSLERSPVLHYLNGLSMSIRRRIFLALIGERFRTADGIMALAMSANLVVSPQDVDRFAGTLKLAVSDNERFYRGFLDAIRESGKA